MFGTAGVMGFPFVPEIEFDHGTISGPDLSLHPETYDGSTFSPWWLLEGPAEIDTLGAAATNEQIYPRLPPFVGPCSRAGQRVVMANIAATEGELTSATFEVGFVKKGGSTVPIWNWVAGRVLS